MGFMNNDLLLRIAEIIKRSYDIGKVEQVYEIFGGYINRSFGIVARTEEGQKKYFFRMYKQGIALNEVKFEHALINHCIARGFTVAARVISNRNNKTFIKPSSSKSIFAVYEFLSGEDKYTWDTPTLNDEEYVSAAKMLANFHNAARDFDPKGLQRKEAKILDLLPTFSASFKRIARSAGTGKFYKYFLDHLEDILKIIDQIRINEKECAKMPHNPIHCDYHPGNLKFEENQVVGIFDFDWSKVDLRLFDISLALVYFCGSWEDEYDGELRLSKCLLFLTTYQDKLRRLGNMEPLNEAEIKNLSAMLAASNLYLINWIVEAYYTDPDLDDDEYLTYLKHTVRLMYWIENHENEIFQMTSALPR